MNDLSDEYATREPFVIVDLESQSLAISQYVKGWKPEQILSWLAKQGSLQILSGTRGTQAFCFETKQGLRVAFMLHGEQFIFIGDNTMWWPK